VLPPIQSLPRIKLKEFFDQIWPIKATRRHVHYKDAALIAAKLSRRFETAREVPNQNIQRH